MFSDYMNRLPERYGSRRGFVSTVWHRLLNNIGLYRRYHRINWNEVDRLVFVCKGNICRSAFAEVVASSQGLNSTSCGLDTVNGASANEKAMEAAKLKGKDLSKHQTTRATTLQIEEGDLFVVMEPWHVARLEGQIGTGMKCTFLGLWHSPAIPHIQDPFGCAPTYFDNCFSLIEQSVDRISFEIKKARTD